MKFRKKPVVIEAIQWTGNNYDEIATFMGKAPETFVSVDQEMLAIVTLEDNPNGQMSHYATIGDWIIRGVKGEYYPCKPDIFEQTYDAA